ISHPMDNIFPIYSSSIQPDASCAFPSWPRCPSLCGSEADYEHPTSFISDKDLMCDDGKPPIHSLPKAPWITVAEIAEIPRELQHQIAKEKDRSKSQAKSQHSAGKASLKTNTKSRAQFKPMTPITECE
ncbi:hypothetical protein QBC32DRAFT_225892, partial [Pseudoneurospora amorphoporcata]